MATVAKRFRHLLVALFFVAAALILFWPLLVDGHLLIQHDLHVSDLNNHALPLRAHLAAGSHWNPYIYGGLPTIAPIQTGACYPPNWFWYRLLPLPWGHNLNIVSVFIIACLSMYLFLQQGGRSLVASMLGALAFGFSGFFMCHIRHLDMINTACWLPLGLWAIDRALVKKDHHWLLVFVAVFALQLLAGHPQIAYYAACLYLLYGLVVSHRRDQRWRFRGLLVISMLLAVALAAAQLLPTLELSKMGPRGDGVSYEAATAFPFYLPDLFNFVYPGANGDPGNASYRPASSFYENYAYLGLAPFLLALFGGLTNRRSLPFVALMVLAFLVVVGKATPVFYCLYTLVPGLNLFRHPTRAMVVVVFCLASMAAIGWDELSKRIAPRRQNMLGALLLIITLADLTFHQRRRLPSVPAEQWLTPPVTAQAMTKDEELCRYYTVDGPASHLAAFRVAAGWWGDLRPYVLQRDMLQPSLNMLFGLTAADGYANLVPQNTTDIWGFYSGSLGLVHETYEREGNPRAPRAFRAKPAFVKLLSLFNVKYVLSLLPLHGDGLQPIPVRGTGVRLYRNEHVLPRAFLTTPRYRVIEDDTIRLQTLVAPDFDPTAEVLVAATPIEALTAGARQSDELPLATGSTVAGAVVIDQYSHDEVSITARTTGPAFLVMSDNDYPGWQALLDGISCPIITVNVVQRGVFIPRAGTHQLRYVFKSKSVHHGGLVSSVAVVLWLCLLGNWLRHGR